MREVARLWRDGGSIELIFTPSVTFGDSSLGEGAFADACPYNNKNNRSHRKTAVVFCYSPLTEFAFDIRRPDAVFITFGCVVEPADMIHSASPDTDAE